MRWPKYWSFSFSIIPSKEIPGLISFTMDWLDLLAVQGTLKSLLQHHSSKASVIWHRGFFIVQLSHLHMTTGKNISLTIRTFVGKVMSLLFNMLSRSEKAMAPHSSTLVWKISWTEEPGRRQSMGSLRVGHNLRLHFHFSFTFTFHFHALEKEMATHSSVLAWRIPGKGELGGLPSMGSHRVRHD